MDHARVCHRPLPVVDPRGRANEDLRGHACRPWSGRGGGLRSLEDPRGAHCAGCAGAPVGGAGAHERAWAGLCLQRRRRDHGPGPRRTQSRKAVVAPRRPTALRRARLPGGPTPAGARADPPRRWRRRPRDLPRAGQDRGHRRLLRREHHGQAPPLPEAEPWQDRGGLRGLAAGRHRRGGGLRPLRCAGGRALRDHVRCRARVGGERHRPGRRSHGERLQAPGPGQGLRDHLRPLRRHAGPMLLHLPKGVEKH